MMRMLQHWKRNMENQKKAAQEMTSKSTHTKIKEEEDE